MNWKKSFVAISVILFLASVALAKGLIHTRDSDNLAVWGYDAVAYFSEGKAVKGLKKFSLSYGGADWLFSSRKNLRKFKKDPKKFAPQFGGYCAWAVGNGYTAEGNPKYWTVYKGKLYLNYNRAIKNKWLRDRDNLIRKAQKNWPGVVK